MENKNQNKNQNSDDGFFLFRYNPEEEEKPSHEGEIDDLDKRENDLYRKERSLQKKDDEQQEVKIEVDGDLGEGDPREGESKDFSEFEKSEPEREVSPCLKEGPSSQEKTDAFSFSKSKAILVKKLLKNIQENNEQLLQIFKDIGEEESEIDFSRTPSESYEGEGDVLEGVFDGENMIGPDGKRYSVPTNYASKSKLVEGDILKLTVSPKGDFRYKQIQPISRARIVGELRLGSDNSHYVVKENKHWLVLNAAVSYFKGVPGDEVVLLIPAEGDSRFGAIENIIKK